MAVVVGTIEPEKILVDTVADEDVDPPVVVHIRASDAEARPEIRRITQRRICYLFKSSVAQIPKDSVFNDGRQF